mgnify:CR=1 FL=1
MSATFELTDPFSIVETPSPLPLLELRQVESGIAAAFERPSTAGRLMIKLVRALNDSLAKIAELESRITELEAKKPKKTA